MTVSAGEAMQNTYDVKPRILVLILTTADDQLECFFSYTMFTLT